MDRIHRKQTDENIHAIFRRRPRRVLLNLCTFLIPQTAYAQDPVAVTFTAPAAGQSVTPGTTVFFDADFTNPTTSGYQITDATFTSTSTDPLVTAEVAGGQISTLFDGADGMGDPFTVAPSPPNTLVPGVFELDLDATVPPGQTVSGSVGFDGFLLDSTGQRTGQSIEVASSSFSVVTATAAPEPSSFALFGFLGLGITGLVLKARKGKAVA